MARLTPSIRFHLELGWASRLDSDILLPLRLATRYSSSSPLSSQGASTSRFFTLGLTRFLKDSLNPRGFKLDLRDPARLPVLSGVSSWFTFVSWTSEVSFESFIIDPVSLPNTGKPAIAMAEAPRMPAHEWFWDRLAGRLVTLETLAIESFLSRLPGNIKFFLTWKRLIVRTKLKYFFYLFFFKQKSAFFTRSGESRSILDFDVLLICRII